MTEINAKDNNHIYITRGDAFVFDLQIISDNKNYIFKQNDIVTLGIYKNLKDPAIILEDFYPNDGDESVRVMVSSNKMKIGNLISTERDYFYEITLNNSATVQGYKPKNKKSILTLLPEGSNVLGGTDGSKD